MKRPEVKTYFRVMASSQNAEIDYDAVTATLGIQPTEIRHAIDRNAGRSGAGRVAGWIYQSPLGPEKTLEEHFSYLVDLFLPRRDELRELCNRMSLRLELDSSVNSYGCQGPEMVFGPDLLRRAAELGAEIRIDLYTFDDDEDEEP
jgi:hypothetical protein